MVHGGILKEVIGLDAGKLKIHLKIDF